MKKILIIGAASAIAEAVAREFAVNGAALFLVARSGPKLETIAADLRVRGASSVGTLTLDACDVASHGAMLAKAEAAMGGLDGALIAHGVLPSQPAAAADAALALQSFEVNASSVISMATHLANRFEAQKAGCLAVISSVAGDRGRASNYVYGAAKAAVSAFCEGLTVRLHQSGVRVLTIKPGPVDTPMTDGMKKGGLMASPAAVGKQIHTAMLRKNGVIYTPGIWRFIMLIIRHIPESVFLKLKNL